MKKTREEIFDVLNTHQSQIKSLGVKSLALFGSGARGEMNLKSDLDFLVEFHHKSFDSYMDLKDFLEELLGTPVDLVIPNTLKDRIRESVLREAIHAPGL